MILLFALFMNSFAKADLITPKETNGFACSASYYAFAAPGRNFKYYPIPKSDLKVDFSKTGVIELERVMYGVTISRRPSGDIATWIELINKKTGAWAQVAGVIFIDNRPILNLREIEDVDGVEMLGLALTCEPYR